MLVLYRFLAIALTGILYRALPIHLFFYLTAGVGFSHYFFAFLESKKRIHTTYLKTSLTWHSVVPWLALIVAIFLIIQNYSYGIVLAFSIHNVFSDVYIFRQGDVASSTVIPRLLMGVISYFHFIFPQILTLEFFLSFILFFMSWILWVAYRSNKQTSSLEIAQILFFELIGVLAVAIFKLPFAYTFICIVMYHFILWVFLSVKLTKKPKMFIVAQQLIFAVLCFVLIQFLAKFGSPYFLPEVGLVAVGYIHIFMSFFTSDFNPKFFLKWQRC